MSKSQYVSVKKTVLHSYFSRQPSTNLI